MAGGNEKVQVVLNEDSDAVVVRGGIRVVFNVSGGIDVYGSVHVTMHPAANDTGAKPKTAPEIGDEMPDGTVYAGISPDTHKAMYVTPHDAPLTMKWKQAMEYAGQLDAHGHKDWRAPTKGELNVLWENRNKGKLAGTFNETGSHPAGWYWSSSQNDFSAWDQRFSDGSQSFNGEDLDSSLRLVR